MILFLTFLGLCPGCSDKLNYTSKKREIKRIKKVQKKSHKHGRKSSESQESSTAASSTRSNRSMSTLGPDGYQTPSASEFSDSEQTCKQTQRVGNMMETECWTKPADVEEKSREEEFDEYLENLLL